MLTWIFRQAVKRMEKRYDYDATYLHEMANIAPAAFRRYTRIQLMGGWRGPLPKAAMHAARIGGALHEDCGPCVQISTDMAVEAGTDAKAIAALLSGKPAPEEMKLAFDFARALLAADEGFDALREAAKARWGEAGVVALGMNAMTARNFPVMKRAMGHAKSCQRVRVGSDEVVVASDLKAA